MPIRPIKKEAQPASTQYTYEQLLSHVRQVIDEEHGGVAKFIESETFTKIGFEDTKSEKSKFHTYLACQSDKTKTVKSFPVLQKLYKGLLGIDLTSRVEVVRTQIIISDKSIL